MKRILVGGSAANPPHLSHYYLIKSLLEFNDFDKLIWIPSGDRPDKNIEVAPEHRRHMTHLLLEPLASDSRLQVDYSDLGRPAKSTIHYLDNLNAEYPDHEIVWYTGVDPFVPRDEHDGKSQVEAFWDESERLLSECTFMVFPRLGYSHPRDLDLPNHYLIKDIQPPDISSSKIRRLLQESVIDRAELEKYLPKNIIDYIEHVGLYKK